MKKLVLAFTLGFAAIIAPVAAGGGWATAGLSSLPPSGLQTGQDWPVEITVLQHGRTPLTGVQPKITIRNVETGATTGTFSAAPTGKDGVYRTVVRFPGAGTWSYEVDDGFSRTHTFKPVVIAGVGAGASFPTFPVGGLVLALLLVGAAILLLRRTRTAPAPAAASR
ncbi:MAG: hypothetical protein MSC30_14050 [Gaiellaceae bacterium MAG52_C11]|nr:hypothetical protein [Candidatus Gaiellasilicea maunaloa]